MNRKDKFFLLFVILSVFAICGEYAVTRPTSNALFLTLFSAKAYPWVWMATVPLNLTALYLYNCFLPKLGPLRMLWIFACFTALINACGGLLYQTLPHFIFFQYAWKDIYVLFMLKQIWSLIHSTIQAERSKILYGFIYGMGTVGAITGSIVPGFLASVLSSEKILLFTLPIYALLLFSYTMAFRASKMKEGSFAASLTEDPRPKEALSLIRRSPVLTAILLLVILMQVSVALMEYRFNAHLEGAIFDKDLRTAYCGKLMGLVNLLSLSLQFIGSFLFIRVFGVRKSHYLVPIFLLTSALFSHTFPSFALISFSYVFLKAVDFSIFGVLREMLYVPLPLDAKFRAKAIIDVFAYRTSKALVSLGLLALQWIGSVYLLRWVSWASIAVFAIWMGIVVYLFRKQPAFQLDAS